MTRVSTYGQGKALITDSLRTQQRMFESQRQVTSGKIANTYKDIPRDTSVLLGAKSIMSRTEKYLGIGTEISRKLATYDILLGDLADTAESLRQEVLKAIGSNLAPILTDQVSAQFDRAVNTMNTRQDGSFIFAGSRTDTAPVNISSIGELAALGTAAEAFDNNNVKISTRLDETFRIQYGVLADEVAQPLFDVMKRIAEFDAGPEGPFSSPMTPAQRDFLKGEVDNLRVVFEGVNQKVGINGSNINTVDRLLGRHRETVTYTTLFISDLEDADIAAAVTNLNNDQLALQASFRVLGQLTQTTLLNYI